MTKKLMKVTFTYRDEFSADGNWCVFLKAESKYSAIKKELAKKMERDGQIIVDIEHATPKKEK